MLTSKTLRAKWVLPIDQPPIENGFVTIRQQTHGLHQKTESQPSNVLPQPVIANLGRWANDAAPTAGAEPVIDLGDVALIPALVNAHTHLEFSHRREPLGHPGIEFTQWIRLVVAERARSVSSVAPDETQLSTEGKTKSSAILRGVAESYRVGVGCIGEIATCPVRLSDYQCRQKNVGLDLVVFHELLGRTKEKITTGVQHLETFLAIDTDEPRVQPGISPHAPYSVSDELLDQIIQVAIRQKLPVAMHLAETEAERELICNQSGPFVELLKDFGIWEPKQFKPNQTLIDILRKLSACSRALIVHGNYLSDAEIEFAARFRDRLHLVYCPRTHHFFGHRPYPVHRFHQAGLLVAVGTDSRASNPDLNLFSELKLIRQLFPQLPDQEILRMGTLDGAKALGKGDRLGSLTPGKIARMSMVTNPQMVLAHDWRWILADESTCVPVMI